LLAWRFVKETPLFIDMQEKNPEYSSSKPFALLFKHCKHNIFLFFILSLIIASIVTVVALLLPSLIELRFVLDNDLFDFSHSLGIIFMVFGCIFYGMLSNHENFGKILMVGSTLLIGQMFAFYYHLQAGGDYVLFMYALLGFFAGIIGMVPAILIQLFPANVRSTGLAFSYNAMYAIVGGILPFALGYATMYISFSPALYIGFIGTIGIMIGIYFYQLPQTQPVHRVVS
jgi:MFS family permease